MSNIGALVRRLIESGCAPDVAAETAAEIFVAGVEAAPQRADATAERRRQKDRERKRNLRGIPPTSAESADSADTPTKECPQTPIENSSSSGLVRTNPSEANPPGDPSGAERELFDRGKAVLGKSAGGLVANLLKAKGGNVALARSVIEMAATKQNPREFIGGAIRQRDGPAMNERSGGFAHVLLEKHQQRQAYEPPDDLRSDRPAIGGRGA